MVLGTLDYIAPEQIRGEPIGPFTDVYSLGCMLAQLLTGEVPFPVPTEEGKLWAHFSEPPPKPSVRVPALGHALRPDRRAGDEQAPRGPLRDGGRGRGRRARGATAGGTARERGAAARTPARRSFGVDASLARADRAVQRRACSPCCWSPGRCSARSP